MSNLILGPIYEYVQSNKLIGILDCYWEDKRFLVGRKVLFGQLIDYTLVNRCLTMLRYPSVVEERVNRWE